jgi:azurin
MFRRVIVGSVLFGLSGALLAATPAPAQAQAAKPAAGKLCKLEIAGNDLIQYDKKELKVAPDCGEVELTLKHVGKLPVQSMGHNWVLVKTPDLNAVANAGLAAGIKNNHVPPGDKRVIAFTKLIGGGQTTSVKFPMSALKKGESYSYVCTFPGHSALMRGKLVIG